MGVPDPPPKGLGAWLTHLYSSEGQKDSAQGAGKDKEPLLHGGLQSERTQKQWASLLRVVTTLLGDMHRTPTACGQLLLPAFLLGKPRHGE